MWRVSHTRVAGSLSDSDTQLLSCTESVLGDAKAVVGTNGVLDEPEYNDDIDE